MEMIDVKYEFHQVLKALNLKIKIDATPVIDLDLGITSAILEDSTNSKYNLICLDSYFLIITTLMRSWKAST